MTLLAQPPTSLLLVFLAMYLDQMDSHRSWTRTGSDEFWSRIPDAGRRKGIYLLAKPAEAGARSDLIMGEVRTSNLALVALGPTQAQDQHMTAIGQRSTSGAPSVP